MIRRILLALGYDVFSNTAIRRAIELAQAHHAELMAMNANVDRCCIGG